MALQTSTGADLVDDSFDDAQVVTPNDTISGATKLSHVRGVVADVGGTISVITKAVADQYAVKQGSLPTAAQAVSFTLVAGQPLRLKVAWVLATGTAATGIKALI